jgi:hypothetical protein
LAASTSKRVVAVRFDREPVRGYVAPATYLGETSLEVLTADGNLLRLPYDDVKFLAFVKSWDEPAEELRKSFISRPKGAGLWVRFDFRDGDTLEALLAANLLEWPAQGFLGAPPDAARNTQRLFVPKAALRQCAVLGAIGSARRPAAKREAAATQLKMFD